jgi:hypothetical protein
VSPWRKCRFRIDASSEHTAETCNKQNSPTTNRRRFSHSMLREVWWPRSGERSLRRKSRSRLWPRLNGARASV